MKGIMENSVEPDQAKQNVTSDNGLDLLCYMQDLCKDIVKMIQTPIEIRNGPRHEKTCVWGLRPGKTQTGLLSWWD